MSLRVIGAGLGRTGTLSTKNALEILGFTRCYHMLEVVVNPDHPRVWADALESDSPDWTSIFDGYAACVDWPACEFWPELCDAFPDAKVLLTVRDADAWCASYRATIGRVLEPPFSDLAADVLTMARSVIGRTFNGRLDDDEYLSECFERRNAEVISAVPEERLLVFDVRSGWDPLCEFLDVPVPDEPFPNLNDRAFFETMISAADPPQVPRVPRP